MTDEELNRIEKNVARLSVADVRALVAEVRDLRRALDAILGLRGH